MVPSMTRLEMLMSMQKNPTHKTEILFARIEPRTMQTFEAETKARGLTKCEAMRQIIAAWLRHPEALPIGLPPVK
jgi:hypothetical protein